MREPPTASASSRAPRPDYREAARLREGLRRFHRRSEQVARAHGLTPKRYELLLLIKTGRDGAERATLGELVERLQLAPSTVTELVHRAEDAGLVGRELSESRRGAQRFRVTAEGERRLERAWRELGVERERLAAVLGGRWQLDRAASSDG
jgi:DNA-binding MarR family transcriptional regulator